MFEACVCILLLAASAAFIKMACWFSSMTKSDKHKDLVTDKSPRTIYMFKTSKSFHVEGCGHLKDKMHAANVYTMCEDCFKKQ